MGIGKRIENEKMERVDKVDSNLNGGASLSSASTDMVFFPEEQGMISMI